MRGLCTLYAPSISIPRTADNQNLSMIISETVLTFPLKDGRRLLRRDTKERDGHAHDRRVLEALMADLETPYFYEREGFFATSGVDSRTGYRLYASSLLTGASHFVACAMAPPIFPRDAPARSRVPFRLRDD